MLLKQLVHRKTLHQTVVMLENDEGKEEDESENAGNNNGSQEREKSKKVG